MSRSVVTMHRDHTMSQYSCSPSALSFPSSPSSIASIASSTSHASKKALKSVKNAVKNAIRPFKKARTMSMSSNVSMVDSDDGTLFVPSCYDVYFTYISRCGSCVNLWW